MTRQPLETFWGACGAEGPFQLSVRHRRERRATIHVCQQPFILVGRDRKNDLVLAGDQVSRRHAYLQVVAGRVYCVDLQSRSGLHWTTGPQPAGWLDSNEPLRIGPYVLRVLPDTLRAAPGSETAIFEPPPLPNVRLDFALDDSHKGSWNMKGLVVQVGGAPNCGVQLVDPSVSRYHCSLVRTPSGVWVVDLLGRGGICVNGVGVRCARLRDGDEMQVGRFMVAFRQIEECGMASAQPANRSLPLPPDHSPSAFPAPTTNGTTVQLACPNSATSIDICLEGVSDSLPAIQEVKLLPDTLPAGELSRDSLVPLVNQFSALHQQMFGQFQQATLMMVQMFTSLQGEQIALIREELHRLHQLTDELQHLHAEAGKPSAEPVPAPAPNTPTTAAASTRAKPANGTKPHSNGSAKPGAPDRNRPAPPHGTAPKASKPPDPPVQPKGPPAGVPEANMHAWITQRIAAIQEEQQSSWQRILQYVVGRRVEDAVL